MTRLYCTNLPDKLRKDDLRLSLYTLFSTYGTVLDIVAMKNKKMRGQAHVVFKDVQASTQALRALQGFDFFGKEMVCLFWWSCLPSIWRSHWNLQKIVYAKGASNVIARLRGTYNAPAVGSGPTGVSSDLQKSIFSGPPGALPPRAPEVNGEQRHGLKRPREEESDEEEAPMEEDSDVPMEASSDED